jgi:dUTP pyrophosphatase
MMFLPVVRPQFTVVQEFSATSERGGGGFGSTGR